MWAAFFRMTYCHVLPGSNELISEIGMRGIPISENIAALRVVWERLVCEMCCREPLNRL